MEFNPEQLMEFLPVLQEQAKDLCNKGERPAVLISDDSEAQDGSKIQLRVVAMREGDLITEKGNEHVSRPYLNRTLQLDGKNLSFTFDDLGKLAGMMPPSQEQA